jgi:hypothetical protein
MVRPRRFVLATVAALLLHASALATTVIPLAFDELVSRAESIVVAQTVRVRPEWRTTATGKYILTTVTFRVERVLKGQAAGAELQLEFPGGEIGGLVMEVDGMPRFEPGDLDVLFVSGLRTSVSPLVGFSSGRFRVTTDRNGQPARVLTHDGRPFAGLEVAGVRAPTLLPRRAMAMTLAEFEALVHQRSARPVGVR